MPFEQVGSMVTLELTSEVGAEQSAPKRIAANRDGREVGLDRITRQLLQRRLRAQRTWCPIEFGINSAEQAE